MADICALGRLPKLWRSSLMAAFDPKPTLRSEGQVLMYLTDTEMR